MIIAVDFDGTCVTHEFPNVGKDIGAVPVLKELVENGHKLILFTMRSDQKKYIFPKEVPSQYYEENFLQDAINWFKQNDIPLYGIQINPDQYTWTSSPKCYAQLYIDDAALGCPLKQDFIEDENGNAVDFDGRPYVDWGKVREMLVKQNLIKDV